MMTFDAEQFRSYALYRRRYIPDECVHLKKDCIWYVSDDLILTSWKAIRPRDDIGGGISAFYPKLGFRISKVFAPDGSLVHWYNDICSVRIEDSEIHYTDLLLDVIVDPDGSLHLLDADEYADALIEGLITKEEAAAAMHALQRLMNAIEDGSFKELAAPIEQLQQIL